MRARVRRAVARLSSAHREVTTRHLDGMEHGQIAAELSLPISVVYSRFHHAKVACAPS